MNSIDGELLRSPLVGLCVCAGIDPQDRGRNL
jgi:hypothetical protein